MQENDRPDIAALEEAFDAAERDARALATGLTGTWAPGGPTPTRGASRSASIIWPSQTACTCARCSPLRSMR